MMQGAVVDDGWWTGGMTTPGKLSVPHAWRALQTEAAIECMDHMYKHNRNDFATLIRTSIALTRP